MPADTIKAIIKHPDIHHLTIGMDSKCELIYLILLFSKFKLNRA